MSIARRIEELEDRGLSPREAVMLWMREAHAFGSTEKYARWLLDQPDEAYPLIRMPAQVVGAVRARNKGQRDELLRDEFYQVQRDVLFLYFLHKQAEMRAAGDHEAICLRVIILLKEIRALINEKRDVERTRLAGIDLEKGKRPRPGKVEKSAIALHEEHVAAWLPQALETRSRILTFLGAADVVSERYLCGEDLLYPDTRENLTASLETTANLLDTYVDFLDAGSGKTHDLRDYVLALAQAGAQLAKDPPKPPDGLESLDVNLGAKLLVEQWILMARSETLEKLGEHREAEALAERLMREQLG